MKVGYHAPAVADPMFVPALAARCGADRRQGREPVEQLPRAAAAAQRTALPRARGARAGLERPAPRCCRRPTRTCTRSPRPPPTATPLDAVEAALLAAARRRAPQRRVTEEELQRAKTQLHARMVFDEDSVTNVAHQLGYFETIGVGRDRSGSSRRASPASRLERGERAGGDDVPPEPTAPSAGSTRCLSDATVSGAEQADDCRTQSVAHRAAERRAVIVASRRGRRRRSRSASRSAPARSPIRRRIPGRRISCRVSSIAGRRPAPRRRSPSPRQPRRLADGHGDAARCFLSSARAWRKTSRRCSASLGDIVMSPVVPGRGTRHAPRRSDDRPSAGRGQSGGTCGGRADGAAVRRRPSVRPPRQGDARSASRR